MPDRAGRDALSGVQSALREAWPERDADPGWTTADDLHLTLRFLGDLQAEQLEQALATLGLPESEPCLPLRFTGIELWPAVRPRLAVARFAEDPRLQGWVASVEDWAVGNGLAPEHRPFAAHVTLLRSPKPLRDPPPIALDPPALRFTAVQAMHRRSEPRGPRYEAHAEYRLA